MKKAQISKHVRVTIRSESIFIKNRNLNSKFAKVCHNMVAMETSRSGALVGIIQKSYSKYIRIFRRYSINIYNRLMHQR